MLEENDLICKVCGADIKEQQRQAADEAAFAGASPTETPKANPADADADGTKVFEPREGSPPQEAGTVAASAHLAPAHDAFEADEARATAAGPSEAEEFHWNIHKFPGAEARKTEDIDFDWSLSPSSIAQGETRDRDESEAGANDDAAHARPCAETIEEFFALCTEREAPPPERAGGAPSETAAHPTEERAGDTPPETAAYPAEERAGGTPPETAAYPAEERTGGAAAPARPHIEVAWEDLGASFGSKAEKSNRAHFFTFDQKNEEFQKLLDREYERLQTYDSPILDEAREMLAAWDWPGFAGKRTDPATGRGTPSPRPDPSEGQPGRDAARDGKTPEAESPREADATAVEAPAEAPAAVDTREAAPPAPAERTPDERPPAPAEIEAAPARADAEALPIPAPDTVPKATPDGPKADTVPEATPDGPKADTVPKATPDAPKADAVPEPKADATDADAATDGPEATPDGPKADAETGEAPGRAEVDPSIGEALDSIEKGIEEWENRSRFSTASKVAMILSVIFLFFTGGSALVKHFTPHSPLDVWLDSVQLQAAAAIKHGVDAIKDLFDDADEDENAGGNDTQGENAGGNDAQGENAPPDNPGGDGGGQE
ncbi:MAG: hypothetical protein LBD95_00115 [Clostridiales Family XIII bacterium]|nr:hypothetical protein [Clostridiales Family XIII bacterium]